MGDDNRLYVTKELVPAYKDQIMSLANVLTPNQFEAELLTGIKIDSKKSALQACQALHDQGVATVVRHTLFCLHFNHRTQYASPLGCFFIQCQKLFTFQPRCAACDHTKHSAKLTEQRLTILVNATGDNQH